MQATQTAFASLNWLKHYLFKCFHGLIDSSQVSVIEKVAKDIRLETSASLVMIRRK